MDGLVNAAAELSLQDLAGGYVRIGTLAHLSSHTRFHLTLRVRTAVNTAAFDSGSRSESIGDKATPRGSGTPLRTTYHRLLLFRLSSASAARPELYCMEATCPHLSAPLSHAPFQEDSPLDGHQEEEEEGGDEVQPEPDLRREMRDMEDVLGLEGDAGLDGDAADACDGPGGSGSRTIVCPWHKYDFDLRDGSSGTGMSVCVYRVVVRGEPPAVRTVGEGNAEAKTEHGDEREVWVEKPAVEGPAARGKEGDEWEVVELRGVSEEFADPPVRVAQQSSSLATSNTTSTSSSSATAAPSSSSDPPPLPPTLTAAALLILQTSSPAHKLALTRAAAAALRSGGFRAIRPTRADERAARALFGGGAYDEPRADGPGETGDEEERRREAWVPPREEVENVQPEAVKKRGKGGHEKSRILMLHALANIEQWAIDLAWDIIARFGHTTVNGEKLPVEFFLDFARMAEDEAKHFSLLAKRLREMGSYYGAHSVHASLWESAIETSHSLSSRLAIIHLVAEARGLDVNPLTIEKFRKAGDAESVRVLEIIHGDEVTHVTTGHRWFTWLCQQRGVDPIATFREEVKNHFRGRLKGPFNDADRAKAGMSRDYYENLEGAGWTVKPRPEKPAEGDERIHPRLT